MVTGPQGASLEGQSLQLLPVVTTLKCEPPELTREDLREVRSEFTEGTGYTVFMKACSSVSSTFVLLSNPVPKQAF